jgi:hypothetical protein
VLSPILKIVCLFVCFGPHEEFFSYLAGVTIAGDKVGPHEEFFSYLAGVTIAGDKVANLDLCLALEAFSSEGSFTCHTYCDTGFPFLRSYPKDS